jgi:hypothetical protein
MRAQRCELAAAGGARLTHRLEDVAFDGAGQAFCVTVSARSVARIGLAPAAR